MRMKNVVTKVILILIVCLTVAAVSYTYEPLLALLVSIMAVMSCISVMLKYHEITKATLSNQV